MRQQRIKLEIEAQEDDLNLSNLKAQVTSADELGGTRVEWFAETPPEGTFKAKTPVKDCCVGDYCMVTNGQNKVCGIQYYFCYG
jgi:hypothetical protein